MGNYSSIVKTTQEYYNSDDADNFYYHVWGGEDIHIGIYENEDEDISSASTRTVETMAAEIANKPPDTSVIDIGAGYGGAARWLALQYGCHVTCLNLSEAQNERNRAMTAKQGLSQVIDVIEGSFEDIPTADKLFDLA